MRALMGTMRAELVGAGGVVERNAYLTKRYIWWDVAWFVWTVANTLTIVFIAKGIEATGGTLDVNATMTTLLIGAVVWAYLGILFEFLMETVAWERWEGTIEYTFMAPLSRAMHLAGQGVFAIMYGLLRATFLFVICAFLFFDLVIPDANYVAALVVLMVASVSFIGIGMMMSVLPLISPEKGHAARVRGAGNPARRVRRLLPGRGASRVDAGDRDDLARHVRARRHPGGDPRGAGADCDVGRAVAADDHRGRLDSARAVGLLAWRAVREEAREAEEVGMSDAAVQVDGLLKVFDVPEREPGLVAAAKSLVRRKTREVRAVDAISFEVAPGEIVGFLGPNGAGKTTTLKMLSGLLYPTGGTGLVLGFVPSKRQREFLSRITLVMGNRNQLQWDLPALDSYELNRAIYRIPREDFLPLRDELIELLEIGDLVRKPIRQLSLGERMKAEIVGALLHRPQVLFLDEPTIGLDVTMQKRIRTFVADYNVRHGATVLLTSHYMADVEALCKRVVVIHHGRILYDGALTGLADTFAAYKTIGVALENGQADLSRYGDVIHRDGDWITLRVPKAETSSITAQLLADEDVLDLNVEDPPIEDVIELVFAQEKPE